MNSGNLDGSSISEEQQALQLAKTCFSQKDYSNAIVYYSVALSLNCTNSLCHSNLALCYYLSNSMQDSLHECEEALHYDPNNIKAIICYSKSLLTLYRPILEINSVSLATSQIQSAFDLCQSPQFTAFLQPVTELRTKISIFSFYKAERNKINTAEILKEYYMGFNNTQVNYYLEKFLNFKINREVPEALVCPITLQMFDRALITPFGNTYEYDYLLKYLTSKGVQDPVTRRQFDWSLAAQNLNLMRAVREFKEKNPWSVYENPKSIEEIKF